MFACVILSVSISAQTDIRKVDFNNFTYNAFCANDEPIDIKVSGGKIEERSGDDYLRFNVQSINYGDLNNDGRDEAVVITVCNMGGTGQFSEGYIFSTKNNKPVLTGRIAGGDRASGGLVSAKIENGLLIVESYEEGGGGLCCPEFIITNKFRLKNNKLADFEKPRRRALYSPNRVSFPKGASSLPFQTEIEYKKRFVVSARKGQTLYVGVNQANSPIYIWKGNANVIKDGNSKDKNGLVAKLDENGDFMFDVFNSNEDKLDYTITVEIK